MFNKTFAKQVFTLMVRKPAAVQQQFSFFWPSGESSPIITAGALKGNCLQAGGIDTRFESMPFGL
jgi:hypothetical protein